MAIDTTDAVQAINDVAEKLLSRLTELQKTTEMEDEHLASAIVGTMTAAVDAGIKIFEANKNNEVKDANIALVNRQKEALDDARKVKTAELVGNTISLIESGGTSAPAELWTALKNSVNAIENGTYPDEEP
jgi:hypothetical protein